MPPEKITVLEGKELEEIKETLNSQFGITKIPGELIMKGKEKVFLFTGELPEKDLKTIEFKVFIERVGTYVAKIEEQGIRLSIEGSQIFKNQITKNVVELNEEEMNTWMHGSEVLKQSGTTGYVIVKYKDDMLGTGKASKEKITNFIPKSRRLKHKQN
jgi:NOL1/NOP2/fmu family ribosome biogenesis protein